MLVAIELDGTHRTYYINIGGIRLVIRPEAFAARVVGVEHIVQGVLVYHQVVLAIGIVGQLGGGQALARTEAVGLEEMGMGQELDQVDAGGVLRRVALHPIVGRAAALRAGVTEPHQGRGLLHVGVLARTVYDMQVGLHQGTGRGGHGVVAGRRGLQRVHGHEAEAVRIIAQGKHAVVRHHDDGVEDGPRQQGHQDEFGQQPAIANIVYLLSYNE